ncbi:MAG: DNA internalization-related competence protein ComEC/Rec2 [Oscillospiraceae bacterium]|nr:DNA internalization-related competence protein ComEC/Rec2 [Oscillospiraceae bacterium]
MRHLVWFAIGYALACGISTWLIPGVGAAGLVFGAGAVLSWCFRRRFRLLLPLTVVLAGLTAGSLWCFAYEGWYVAPARECDGQEAILSLTLTDDAVETEYGGYADGTIRLSGRRYQVRLYLEAWNPLRAGDRVTVKAKLRCTADGSRSDGILFTASQRGDLDVESGKPLLGPVLRGWFRNRIDGVFSEDTRGFAKALLLGDKSGLTGQQLLSFQTAGVSHIVAVSGLHMSVLFALVCLVTGRHRFWTTLLGVPVVLTFGWVAGFTPSVTRAVLMELLFLAALALDRENDPPTALAFAVVVMLTKCPMTIASVGFQLSVASVAGIFLFFGPVRQLFRDRFALNRRTARGICDGMAVSISASLLSTPLVAWYFGYVSLVSVAANVLIVPAVSLVFYGVLGACVFAPVAWFTEWGIRYVLTGAKVIGGLPFAAVYTESVYIVIWLALCYVLVWYVLRRNPLQLRPVFLTGLAGLCLALALSWTEPRIDDYRVTVLDVGQGQCVLLQSRGNVFLVDCGGDSDAAAGNKAADELMSMGFSRIDGLILTHYDRDHTGGISQLALRVGIDRIYLPRSEDELPALPETEQIWLDGEGKITFGTCTIRIFPPESGKSGNESCASVLFQNEKYDTLICSDISASGERRLLEQWELPDLELLVVGHHGSASATSAELLYRLRPELAFLSVGRDNPYGHPAPLVLARLARYGCTVYRTDLSGDLTFRG